MEGIKNSLVNGMVDIPLKIAKVAAKSLVFVPLLYLFCWLTGRHMPSYETFAFFFLGGLWFTDVSDNTRQNFIRFFHDISRQPTEAKPH